MDLKCPKCKSRSDLIRRVTLTVYPANWPWALLFVGTVIWFGGMLALGGGEILLFSAAALIPAVATFRSRVCCERCHVSVSEPAAPVRQRSE